MIPVPKFLTAPPATPGFAPWTNTLVKAAVPLAGLGGLYTVFLIYYGLAPTTLAVGYAPEQPVPYSHKIHAGQLGIDCRYCHTGVFDGAKALVPPTRTCMNCHNKIHAEGDHQQAVDLAPIRRSYATGLPVPWVKVHDLADYAYFDHSAHVNRGVGCASCHGRVDRMTVVTQVERLSMKWCLDCHRDPDPHLRPLDRITDMTYQPTREEGRRIREMYNINPRTDCSTCHR